MMTMTIMMMMMKNQMGWAYDSFDCLLFWYNIVSNTITDIYFMIFSYFLRQISKLENFVQFYFTTIHRSQQYTLKWNIYFFKFCLYLSLQICNNMKHTRAEIIVEESKVKIKSFVLISTDLFGVVSLYGIAQIFLTFSWHINKMQEIFGFLKIRHLKLH